MPNPCITTHDRDLLRRLAKRIRDIAAKPGEEQKRQAWIAHNRLQPGRPRVLCFPEGAWLECIPPETLATRNPLLRGWETRLRMALYTHEVLADDQVLDPVFNVPWDIQFSNWGLDVHTDTPDPGRRQRYFIHPYLSLSLESHSALGAAHYTAPMTSRSDLASLRLPEVRVDEDSSHHWLELAHELFDGILDVRRRGNPWLLIGGFPVTAVQLRGMENFMLDLYDDPPWVHEFLRFLAAGHNACLDRLEQGGYLTLNNGAEWIGTGGIGYTDELPNPNRALGPWQCRDVWGGLQAQDLVGLSGDMFAEFFLPHLRPIMERFGLSHFGCCEPVHDWLPHLRTIRNLRRISISPWADVRRCAEQMGNRYVFSYKPLPTDVCMEHFDEDALARRLTAALTHTREYGCVVEVILKDLHTIRHQPDRLRRWVQLVRRVVDEIYAAAPEPLPVPLPPCLAPRQRGEVGSRTREPGEGPPPQ